MTTAVQANGADGFLQAYGAQVSKLESDPNATPAFKKALEQQLQAVQKQVQDQAPSQVQAPADGSAIESSKAAAPSDPPPAYTPGVAPPPETPSDPPPANTAGPPAANAAPQTDAQPGGNLPSAFQQLQPDIEEASRVTGEDSTLMAAQAYDESRLKSGATTTNGGTGQADAGLMQVDAATFQDLQQKHPELQGKSLSDNLVNLEAGGFLEQDEKKKFGSDALALRAYNSGEGSVDPSDPNKTTTGLGDPDYVQKVLALQQDIKSGTPLPA